MELVHILDLIHSGREPAGPVTSTEGVTVSVLGDTIHLDYWGDEEIWLFDPPVTPFAHPVMDNLAQL